MNNINICHVVSTESTSFTTPIRLRIYSNSRQEVDHFNAMTEFELTLHDTLSKDSIHDPQLNFHCTMKPIQQTKSSPLASKTPAMISVTQRLCAGRILFCFTPKAVNQPISVILQNCTLYMRAHLATKGNPSNIVLPDIEFDSAGRPSEPYILLKCATGRFVKGGPQIN